MKATAPPGNGTAPKGRWGGVNDLRSTISMSRISTSRKAIAPSPHPPRHQETGLRRKDNCDPPSRSLVRESQVR